MQLTKNDSRSNRNTPIIDMEIEKKLKTSREIKLQDQAAACLNSSTQRTCNPVPNKETNKQKQKEQKKNLLSGPLQKKFI